MSGRARRKRGPAKRWARGTARGILRNLPIPLAARVHPRRIYGDNRVPWKRRRIRTLRPNVRFL